MADNTVLSEILFVAKITSLLTPGRASGPISNLVFYAQSAITVVSGL